MLEITMGWCRWDLLTLTMFSICLPVPVDVLIFFKEPLGPFGTLFATIWAKIPFLVMVGDATFPEKEIVEDKSKDTLYTNCYNVF